MCSLFMLAREHYAGWGCAQKRGDRDLKVTVCTDRSTSQHPTNNYVRQASEKQSQGHHKTLENLEAARMSMKLF